MDANATPLDHRVTSGLRARNAVVGEHRDHTTAHYRHDEEHEIEFQIQAALGREIQLALHGQMHGQDQQAHYDHQADEEIVALILGTPERDGDGYADCKREGRIDQRGEHRPGRQHEDAASQPQGGEQHQRRSTRRLLSGPGADGSQQKTRDDRRGVAEQHFVAVPERVGEIETGQKTGELPGPEQHAKHTEQAGEQIERAEAEVPEGEAGWRCGCSSG